MDVLLALLFLADVFSLVSANDRFTFDVTFTCAYRDKYSYNLQFFERDTFSLDDVMTHQMIGDASTGLFHVELEGWQNGDEVWSSGYHVQMVLYHNCTTHGDEVTVYLNLLPKCLIGRGTCSYTIREELKDLSGSIDYQADLMYS